MQYERVEIVGEKIEMSSDLNVQERLAFLLYLSILPTHHVSMHDMSEIVLHL